MSKGERRQTKKIDGCFEDLFSHMRRRLRVLACLGSVEASGTLPRE